MTEPIIVREASSEIRAIARNALRGSWPKVAVIMGLYYLMTVTVPALLAVLIPSAASDFYLEYTGSFYSVSYVAGLYEFVVTGAFSYGLCSFMLAFFRQKEINGGHLFNGFEHFLKAFCLFIVQSVFIFLWGLLLVIPGIIAAFRYSQAYYLLADHPEMGVMDAMRESKRIMQGNKGKLFCLMLSFIGWAFLASIPTALVEGIDPFGVGGAVIPLLDFVAAIPLYFLNAYINTAETAFYDLATGHLVAQSQTAFHEEDYNF